MNISRVKLTLRLPPKDYPGAALAEHHCRKEAGHRGIPAFVEPVETVEQFSGVRAWTWNYVVIKDLPALEDCDSVSAQVGLRLKDDGTAESAMLVSLAGFGEPWTTEGAERVALELLAHVAVIEANRKVVPHDTTQE